MSSILEYLFPGIPDDVTLNHIVTKLSWKDCRSLSGVSLSWQAAIESRKVYDSRLYHHSTDTLTVVKHQDCMGRTEISLYSLREKVSYKLPPISNLQLDTVARMAQLISLQGKLYVLGDMKNGQWQDIYELDLAGKWQWKKCANIPESIPDEFPVPLRDNLSTGCGVFLRNKFYLRAGDTDCFKSAWQVHDPDKGVFRTVCPFQFPTLDSYAPLQLFWDQGKSYVMTPSGIHRWNPNTLSWTLQHSSIFADELGTTVEHVGTNLILPVCGELLAITRWIDPMRLFSHHTHGYSLLQSRGFGTASQEIVWEKGSDSFHFDENISFAVCPVQL